MNIAAVQVIEVASDRPAAKAEERRDVPRSPLCFIELEAERDNDAAVRSLLTRIAFAGVFLTAGYVLAELT